MWLKSCLRRTQKGQSFNSIGKLEIPEMVQEELLQNALVHYDLLKTAAIRLLVFDDRVEIVNPGCVFGGHTLDEVLLGNSFARNPLMANFCAKTMPYCGLGSGIPRVLAEKCHVEFIDSKDGNQFTARITRPIIDGEKSRSKGVKNEEKSRSKGVNDEEKSRSKGVNDGEKSRSKGANNGEKSRSKEEILLDFCTTPRTLAEISVYLNMKEKYFLKRKYIDPLLGTLLQMTEPNSPNSPTQKYVTIRQETR